MIKRNISNTVKNLLGQYPIILLTGARQVGKTTLVSQFQKESNYKYISLDDKEIFELAAKDPVKLLKEFSPPLIIDEVQKATNLFDHITSIVNETRRTKGNKEANGMFILTSSQKYHSMKNVTESMTGRVAIIEMPPLSQSEINNQIENPFFIDSQSIEPIIKRSAYEYKLNQKDLFESIINGFYPINWTDQKIKPSVFYRNYLKTYLERDVNQLINLKDKNKFNSFIKLLASSTANDYIPEKLANDIGVDKKTISSWTSILEAGDIITLLEPYNEQSMSKRVSKKKRIYFNDTGLVCYLLNISSQRNITNKNKGKLVETYIFNEIKKSYLNNGVVYDFSYYRDSNQNEIDLIIFNYDKGSLNLIECKSGINYDLKDIKGFKQLQTTNYEISGQTIICLTDEPYRLNGTTIVLPITAI